MFAGVVLTAEAQDFKVFPGSRTDPTASKQASSPRTKSEIYTTDSSFEKVVAFYRARYPEYAWRIPAPSLPSGKKVQWAYFLIDGAKDIRESKYWLKVQRPYIGTIGEDGGPDFKDIRDLTVIQTVQKR